MSSLKPNTLLQKRFETGKVLGRGGFAFTYEGMDTLLKRRVAIKEFFPVENGKTLCVRSGNEVLPLDMSAPDFIAQRDRFYGEATLLAAIHHPGVVLVYDIFEENNTTYIVMEFLEGTTLYSRCLNKLLPVNEALSLLGRIADPVAYIHTRGMIHRDLNPKNVIMTNDNRVVLIDFGLAKTNITQTQTLTAMCFPGFAPPEQYRGGRGKPEPSLDVYALAALLYFMLTGCIPQDGARRYDLNTKSDSLEAPHVLVSAIPLWLSAAVVKGMALVVSERPQSVAALLALLQPPAPAPQAPHVQAAPKPTPQVQAAPPQAQPVQKPTPVKIPTPPPKRKRTAPPTRRPWILVVPAAALLGGGTYAWNTGLLARIPYVSGKPVVRDFAASRATLASALKVARGIEYGGKVKAIGNVAVAQVKIGDTHASNTTFSAALNAVRKIEKNSDGSYGDSFSHNYDLTDLVESQAKAGNVAAAQQTVQQISKDYKKEEAFGRIAISIAKKGDVAEALRFARSTKADSSSLKGIAVLQAEAGDLPGAIATAQQIGDDFDKAAALEAVVKAQAKNGDVAAALKTLQTLRRESHRSDALKHVAVARAAQKNFPAAFQTVQQIASAMTQVSAYTEIGVLCAQAGDTYNCQRAFAFALVITQKREDGTLRACELWTIGMAQADAGDSAGGAKNLAAAREMMQKIISGKVWLSDQEEYALHVFAVAQAKTGDIPAALKTARQNSPGIERASTLCDIAVLQAKAKNISTAVAIAREAHELNSARESGTLAKIAVLQAKFGDVPGALKLAAEVANGPHASSDSDVADALTQIALVQAGFADEVAVDEDE